MRRRLTARSDARRPRAAERVDRLGRREVKHVDATALIAGEREVALDRNRLGDGRIAREAEFGRYAALVDVAAVRERRLLAVEGQRPIGGRGVLECPAHETGGRDRGAVVREGDRARLGEL